MDYSKQLSTLSAAIESLSSHRSNDIRSLCGKSENQIKIYQQNRLFGVHEHLKIAFKGTYIHAEPDNFRFFIKSFLGKVTIKSYRFTQLRYDFRDFISFCGIQYQDPILSPLAKLDYLANDYETIQEDLDLPLGLFDYWHKMVNEHREIDYDISLEQLESVRKNVINNEIILSLAGNQ